MAHKQYITTKIQKRLPFSHFEFNHYTNPKCNGFILSTILHFMNVAWKRFALSS